MRLLYTALLVWTVSVAAARTAVSLNFGWEFTRDGQEMKIVDLPHDFQIEQPWVAPSADERPDNADIAANVKSRLSSRGFKEMGEGTYRRSLFVSDSLRDRRVLLDFEGIMLVGDVYLNGERVGGTDYGYLGFECDISDKVSYGADNEIRVVASTGAPQNSRWYTGGGLYRNVWLVTTPKDLYFNRHPLQISTSEVGDDRAVIVITADINARKPNESFIADIDIVDNAGNIAVKVTKTIKVQPKWRSREYVIDTLHIDSPRLWDIDTPDLYQARVVLRRSDGSVADSATTRFGVRSLKFSPDFGLKLNGRKVLLKGIANHHTLGALGAAAYPRAIAKRIKLLKEFGFNHIRTSHNPYSEDFLNLCDEYGILVVDELYDKWLTQYAGGRRDWSSLWQENIPEWIKRDRNHPSVIVWSLGNELQGYSNLPFNDWGVTAYRLQKTLLDRYDTSRPVTVAMHPRYRSLETDSLPAPLVHETDIASYNYRYMYFPGDAARFPWMIFYQSEANLSGLGPNFFIPDNDRVLGLAYWGMIDYLGESFGWPAKGWVNGVFDISLNPKPNAWMIKSMFTDEPVVRIGVVSPDGEDREWNGVRMGQETVSDSWNHHRGDSLKIYTYTNADEVELLLNGKSLGRKRNEVGDPNIRNRIVWTDVVYDPGTLNAVAYSGGVEVGRHDIHTALTPCRLIVSTDNDSWRSDGTDLQHVYIEAVDQYGHRCPDASDTLSFELDGDASIVAVSNGDLTSDESYVGTRRSLHQGRALVILRAGLSPGPVKLTITSDCYPKEHIIMHTCQKVCQ